MLEKWFKDDFSKVLAKDPRRSIPEDNESKAKTNDPMDHNWKPWKHKREGKRTFSSDAMAGTLDAMDGVLLLSMLMRGTTPQLMAAEQEKRNEERELRSQGRIVKRYDSG